MLPMIDVVEVGAGGGSIAWRDDIGALKVGPQSAGADPGPICYRGGGTEPTITDANVVLGRLDPDNFLGGTMKLDAEAARARHQGQDRRAAQARHDRGRAGDRRYRDQQDVARGARGVGRQGLRSARLRAGGVRRRGPAACLRDRARASHPDRDRAAVSLALLGARHAARRRAPRLHPHRLFRSRQRRFRQARRRCTTRWWRYTGSEHTHISTLDILRDERHHFIRTYSDSQRRFRQLAKVHEQMREGAQAACAAPRIRAPIHLDLRYVGQEFTLAGAGHARRSSSSGDRKAIRTAFDELYEHRYAHHSPDEPVEMVNIRLGAIGKRPKLELPEPRVGGRAQRRPASAQAYFTVGQQAAHCQVYRRDDARRGRARSPGRR